MTLTLQDREYLYRERTEHRNLMNELTRQRDEARAELAALRDQTRWQIGEKTETQNVKQATEERLQEILNDYGNMCELDGVERTEFMYGESTIAEIVRVVRMGALENEVHEENDDPA